MNLLLRLVLLFELFISVSKCKINYSPPDFQTVSPTSGPIDYVLAHASTQVDNKSKSSPVTSLE